MFHSLSRAALAALFLSAAPAFAQSAGLPPAATLVARYSAAIGGDAYINAKSVVTKGGMSMPASGISASFEMTQLAPNRMQMVTTIPGMGAIQVGYDGTTAWSMDPMQGARVLAGPELIQLTDDADRRAAVRAAEMFTALETVADTSMNSERCFLVKLTWKSGRESFDCYSPATGFIVGSRSTQKTAMGDIPVVTLFTEYRKFGDVMIATKTIQEAMGQQQILTIESVLFGDGTGIAIAPPAAVQALVKPPAK